MAAELGRLERGHPDSEFLPFLNSGNYSLLFKFWNVAPKVRVCVCVCVCVHVHVRWVGQESLRRALKAVVLITWAEEKGSVHHHPTVGWRPGELGH